MGNLFRPDSCAVCEGPVVNVQIVTGDSITYCKNSYDQMYDPYIKEYYDNRYSPVVTHFFVSYANFKPWARVISTDFINNIGFSLLHCYDDRTNSVSFQRQELIMSNGICRKDVKHIARFSIPEDDVALLKRAVKMHNFS